MVSKKSLQLSSSTYIVVFKQHLPIYEKKNPSPSKTFRQGARYISFTPIIV